LSCGVDHLDVLAGAFADADREDRAQRRQRATALTARREASPPPPGRTHAEVLNDYFTWSNWIDQADGAATVP
jgi:hypothetical protein